MTKDQHLRDRARRVIPNGMYGHMATGMLPEGYPQFYVEAKGSRLRDVNGTWYVDCLSAFGPNLLGYGDPAVQQAILDQLARADTTTGPSPLMVDLAEAMVDLLDHADWAMFCKNGSDATGMAVMMARAHTGRRKILIGRDTYHGAQIWSTPRLAGVLPSDREHQIYFDFNDPDSFAAALAKAGDDVAGVIVTPWRHELFQDQVDFDPAMARLLRATCDRIGAVLILDEVRSGFRLVAGDSWSGLGVQPDLACWGKVLGNGQPISAVTGAEALRQAAAGVYVTGSFWFSAVPMAAALETLRQVREGSYLTRMVAAGTRFRTGLDARAAAAGFALAQSGPVTMPQVLFHDDADYRLGYGFTRLMAGRGVLLSPYHNMFMNAAMAEAELTTILAAADTCFAELAATRTSLPEPPAATRARLGLRPALQPA